MVPYDEILGVWSTGVAFKEQRCFAWGVMPSLVCICLAARRQNATTVNRQIARFVEWFWLDAG